MGQDHQNQDRQQVEGEERRCDMVGNQPEEGRHQAGARVGAGHLDANDRLGPIRAEVVRRGMNDAGINGRAAQADQDQSRKGGVFPQRQQNLTVYKVSMMLFLLLLGRIFQMVKQKKI